jgi:hypothetical protein
MTSRFNNSSSGIARVVSVLAAFVVTATLFSAVVIGLTEVEGGTQLAQGSTASAVQA